MFVNNNLITGLPVFDINKNVSNQYYRFNNLGNILDPYMITPPYVNEIQFYNPINGQLGPNISQQKILSDMAQSFTNDNKYKPVINSQIHSHHYNNSKISIGLIGSHTDINTVKSILDKYL